MPMNKTETLAYAWLIEQGYSEADITFRHRQSPDFLTEDGKGWEVKLARQKQVVFSETQIIQLREHPDVTILIFDDPEPLVAPFSSLLIPGYYRGYHLKTVDYGKYPMQSIRMPTEMRDQLREEHARTYTDHRLSFNNWLVSRIQLSFTIQDTAVNP